MRVGEPLDGYNATFAWAKSTGKPRNFDFSEDFMGFSPIFSHFYRFFLVFSQCNEAKQTGGNPPAARSKDFYPEARAHAVGGHPPVFELRPELVLEVHG
jgi:hypothetical protein